MGRWLTFIRNGQIDPKKRNESSARHQKWLKNPQKTKIRQSILISGGDLIVQVTPLQSCHSQGSQKKFVVHVVVTIQTV
jgi:hypothetical protein